MKIEATFECIREIKQRKEYLGKIEKRSSIKLLFSVYTDR
jgi:hypothetical protein